MCHIARISIPPCQGGAEKVSPWQAILDRVRSTLSSLPKWICGSSASRLFWGHQPPGRHYRGYPRRPFRLSIFRFCKIHGPVGALMFASAFPATSERRARPRANFAAATRSVRRKTKKTAFLPSWGAMWGSNPRHLEPQSSALPTELIAPFNSQPLGRKDCKYKNLF